MSATTPGVVKKLMVADEFWEFVQRLENQDRNIELIRGEVVEVSRPTKPHGAVTALVIFELQLYARVMRKGYVVSNDLSVAIADGPDSVLGPDVAYFMDANKFEDMQPKCGDVPPVLVVEVSSPNDRAGRVNTKIRGYLKGGVKLVWQVDYEERNVTVYRPKQGMEVIGEDGELTGGDDLPGLSIKVANLFKLPGDWAAAPPPQPPSA